MSSSAAQAQLQPAFLLHHYPYRESSRLLECLTRDYGRVGIVARGARSPRSRFRGVIRPFAPVLISWVGRGELGTLTTAELQAGWSPLPAARLNSGWYLNELLLRLTRRHDSNEAVFSAYSAALAQLGSQQSEAAVLRVFEKRLLDALGYGIDLLRTGHGQQVEAARFYLFKAERGLFEAGDGGEPGRIAGQSLIALATENFCSQRELREARQLLRTALEFYLGPRPLRVREVTAAMHRGLK